MLYSYYDSSVPSKMLSTNNGLFTALVILGASRCDDVLDCIDTTERYTALKIKYTHNKDSLGLCSKGVRYICTLLRFDGIKVRRRKCMSYVLTRTKKPIYVDTAIPAFTRTLLHIITTDEALKKLMNEEFDKGCPSFSVVSGNPELNDCVHHFLGFEYTAIHTIIDNRQHPKSKKSQAIRKCLEEVKSVIRTAGYPQ